MEAATGDRAARLPQQPQLQLAEYRDTITYGARYSESSSGNEDSDAPAECDNDRMWIFAQRLLPQKRQRAQPSVADDVVHKSRRRGGLGGGAASSNPFSAAAASSSSSAAGPSSSVAAVADRPSFAWQNRNCHFCAKFLPGTKSWQTCQDRCGRSVCASCVNRISALLHRPAGPWECVVCTGRWARAGSDSEDEALRLHGWPSLAAYPGSLLSFAELDADTRTATTLGDDGGPAEWPPLLRLRPAPSGPSRGGGRGGRGGGRATKKARRAAHAEGSMEAFLERRPDGGGDDLEGFFGDSDDDADESDGGGDDAPRRRRLPDDGSRLRRRFGLGPPPPTPAKPLAFLDRPLQWCAPAAGVKLARLIENAAPEGERGPAMSADAITPLLPQLFAQLSSYLVVLESARPPADDAAAVRAAVRSRLDALLASFHAEIAAIADAAAQRDGGGGRARALATAIAHEFGSLRSRHPPLADVLRDARFAKGLVADGAAPSHEPPPPQLQLRWAVLDTVARLAAGAPADGGDGVWALVGRTIAEELLPLFAAFPAGCCLPARTPLAAAGGGTEVCRPLLALWHRLMVAVDAAAAGWEARLASLLDATGDAVPTPWGRIAAEPPSLVEWRRRVVLSIAPLRHLDDEGKVAAAAPRPSWELLKPILTLVGLTGSPARGGRSDGDDRAVKQALRLCCDLSDAWAPSKAGFDVALDVWKALPPPAASSAAAAGGARSVRPPLLDEMSRWCDGREAALPPGRDDDARALALRFLFSELSRLSGVARKQSTSKLRMWATGVQRVSDPDELWCRAAAVVLAAAMAAAETPTMVAAAVTQLTGLADVGATPPPAEGVFSAVVEAHLTLLSLAQSHGGCRIAPHASALNRVLSALKDATAGGVGVGEYRRLLRVMLDGYAAAVCRVERDAAVGAAADARAADTDEGYDEADLLKPEGNSSSSCALAELLSHADAEVRSRALAVVEHSLHLFSAEAPHPAADEGARKQRAARWAKGLEAVLASAPWGGGGGGGGGSGGGSSGGDGAAGVLEREAVRGHAAAEWRWRLGACWASALSLGVEHADGTARAAAARAAVGAGAKWLLRDALLEKEGRRLLADAPTALGFCAAVLRRGGGAAAALLGHGAWADVERAWFCAMAADASDRSVDADEQQGREKIVATFTALARAAAERWQGSGPSSGAAAAESLFLPSLLAVQAAAVPVPGGGGGGGGFGVQRRQAVLSGLLREIASVVEGRVSRGGGQPAREWARKTLRALLEQLRRAVVAAAAAAEPRRAAQRQQYCSFAFGVCGAALEVLRVVGGDDADTTACVFQLFRPSPRSEKLRGLLLVAPPAGSERELGALLAPALQSLAALRYYGGGVDAELRDFLDHHLAAGAASADLLHAAVGAADEKVRLHVVYVLTKYHRLSAAVRADSAVRATGDNGAVDGALARFVDKTMPLLKAALVDGGGGKKSAEEVRVLRSEVVPALLRLLLVAAKRVGSPSAGGQSIGRDNGAAMRSWAVFETMLTVLLLPVADEGGAPPAEEPTCLYEVLSPVEADRAAHDAASLTLYLVWIRVARQALALEGDHNQEQRSVWMSADVQKVGSDAELDAHRDEVTRVWALQEAQAEPEREPPPRAPVDCRPPLRQWLDELGPTSRLSKIVDFVDQLAGFNERESRPKADWPRPWWKSLDDLVEHIDMHHGLNQSRLEMHERFMGLLGESSRG